MPEVLGRPIEMLIPKGMN